jgi:hypothetical protein
MKGRLFWRSLCCGLATEALMIGLFLYCAGETFESSAVSSVIFLLHFPALAVLWTAGLPLTADIVLAIGFEAMVWALGWWFLLSLFDRKHGEVIRLSLK